MKPRPPRVRLAVPTTGHRLPYLQQCLESISRQDESIEIVMVAPAAAAPGLRALAENYSCQFMVEHDHGISNAINQAWEDARTDYVAWLGDDDLLADGSISAAVEELDRSPAAVMVYGRVRVIDAQGDHVYTMRPGKFAASLMRYGPNLVWQPGSLYRRSAVQEAGMLDSSLRYAMDFDLHLRLRQKGALIYLPQLLASFRYHPTSLTADNPEPTREPRLVVRRYLGPVARSWEGCWWPVVKNAGRAWGAIQMRTGQRCDR
ncbi:glycosyltransferase [Streptomyces sp. RB6PN25]|uniref:Glycosyltransferase n=1 Tax=Streptomyces humicola TaxID=2953240 RepID=A0ABT1PPU3_9ACTN|nr:glycosyltransferase [Streptomyces humicola]MCQ4079691.1 glycosyltransferase [Streptomyces humicola]